MNERDEYGQCDDNWLLMSCPREREVIASGENAWLETTLGKRLLDLGSGQVCAVFGHSHPRFKEYVGRQLGDVWHLGGRYLSENVSLAAKELLSIAPSGLSRVMFVSTGTEANELAFRLARCATGREILVSQSEAYFGTSYLARSLSKRFVEDHVVVAPKCRRFETVQSVSPTDVVESLRLAIRGVESDVAAVAIEPLLGTHGVVPLPEQSLRQVADFAKATGALTVIDEAKTGIGRCGSWFFCDREMIQPDIMVLSKCIGNGFPVACVIVTEDVYRRACRNGFYYLSSNQNNPLACAAALATIRTAKEIDAPSVAQSIGIAMFQRLQGVCGRWSIVSGIRACGLLLGIQMCDPAGLIPPARISRATVQGMLRRGVICGYGDWGGVIRLAVPFCLTEDDMSFAMEALEETLREVNGRRLAGYMFPEWNDPMGETRRFFENHLAFRTEGIRRV